MKVSKELHDLVEARKGKFISTPSYTIKLMTPDFVAYFADNKQITFSAELLKEEGSSFWSGRYLAIYVESPLRWDNVESPIPAEEEQLIMERITHGLKKLGRTSRLLPRPQSA